MSDTTNMKTALTGSINALGAENSYGSVSPSRVAGILSSLLGYVDASTPSDLAALDQAALLCRGTMTIAQLKETVFDLDPQPDGIYTVPGNNDDETSGIVLQTGSIYETIQILFSYNNIVSVSGVTGNRPYMFVRRHEHNADNWGAWTCVALDNIQPSLGNSQDTYIGQNSVKLTDAGKQWLFRQIWIKKLGGSTMTVQDDSGQTQYSYMHPELEGVMDFDGAMEFYSKLTSDLGKQWIFVEMFKKAVGPWGSTTLVHDDSGNTYIDYIYDGNHLSFEQALHAYMVSGCGKVWGGNAIEQLLYIPPGYITTNAKGQTVFTTPEYILPIFTGGLNGANFNRFCRGISAKTIRFVTQDSTDKVYGMKINPMIRGSVLNMFEYCPNLEEIQGDFDFVNTNAVSMFAAHCPKLKTFTFYNVHANLNLGELPSVSKQTIQNILERRSGTNAFTLTLHSDIYAKITDTADTEWYPLLALAEQKNVALASA